MVHYYEVWLLDDYHSFIRPLNPKSQTLIIIIIISLSHLARKIETQNPKTLIIISPPPARKIQGQNPKL
jgi:hypothetical protein